ncbi:FAD:protein FMN transferase [Nannocystis bainbridge]|uniref:FAD:protein FMN transferase n=1 Tax=Nannocystis bainbridge TaxID=2995303 RepID=A0ABT5E2Q7_9BACT|nr:FAD:protein FMN transferase [Nannocystis bainbridge]MDC0720161.1 FAD:protein FMN transferase [Nannocystis bainbridge]
MGTTWRVTVVHEGRDPAPILPMIEAELAQIDREMSTWRDDSAISEFNRRTETSAFPAPAALVEVVAQARDVSERSGGAFDVTVSPLVDAWGFGRPGPVAAPPTDEQLAALRAQVGWQSLHADREAATLRKDQPALTITLSAIAPGYAADVLSDRLVALGFPRHLVDVGGEFRARGDGPEGPWRLGIERPDGPTDERVVQEVVPLRDAALATSGDYRNYREQAGRRISHTIDPRSGRPIDHKLASVTVIHRTAALADAYATALNVLGPEDGFALAEREALPALFLVREGDGFAARATAAFAALRGAPPSATLSP